MSRFSEADLKIMTNRAPRLVAARSQRHETPLAAPHLPLMLAVTGQLPSGKNQVQLLFRNGQVRKYPNKVFTNWRAKAHFQILEQVHFNRPVITVPVMLKCQYWPGDNRVRDVSGMLDALFHLLTYTKVLKDDGLIYNVSWQRYPVATFPKVIMDLTAWKSI